MGLYAMTGGASGIGANFREQMLAAGHEVISVDIQEGDIIADLSTAEGRQAAIDGIRKCAPDGLDGFIPCAGLSGAAPVATMAGVNFFAVVATVEGLRDLLARKRGSVLIVSSSSATMLAPSDEPLVQAYLRGDEQAAVAELKARDDAAAVYASSKRAIAIWMRRNAADYARGGVCMNAVAPGMTLTPMMDEILADETMGETTREYGESLPWGGPAQPEQIANVMMFLLSPAAEFVCGSVFFVDGGADTLIRPDNF